MELLFALVHIALLQVVNEEKGVGVGGGGGGFVGFFALPSSLPKVIAAVHVVADHQRVNKKRTT